MHYSWDWLGPASSVATVVALVITLLYYLYLWPFNLKKPEGLTVKYENNQIRLHWKPVQRASHYSLYRTDIKTGVMDIYSCATYHHTDTSPVAGAVYHYYVMAEDQGHQSSQSATVPVNVPARSPTPLLRNAITPKALNDDLDLPESQWPLEDLRRLLAELKQKDNKTVLAILELTASKPNIPVSFADVCQYAGVTSRQGGTGIGALTKLINRLGKTKWPFTYPPGQGGPFYQLSIEMTERWRQVEAEGVIH